MYNQNEYTFYDVVKINTIFLRKKVKMIKIVIIDDEENILNIVENIVKKAMENKIEIYTYLSVKKFWTDFEEKMDFDIVISDVEMPEIGGIELGKRIKWKKSDIYLIYLTSYSMYAVQSYEIEAYQYILKENMQYRLPIVLSSLINKFEKDKDKFRFIGSPMNKEKIYYKEIIYMCKEKTSKYVRFVTTRGIYKERITLTQIIKELGSAEFLLTERGYVVNVNHLDGIKENLITMDNGEQIIISRSNLKRVKEQINLYRGRL